MAKRRAANRAEGRGTQFFKIILSPHASKLHIPDEFVMKYGANLGDNVILEVPTGARWEVKLQHSNGMAWLKEGWNPFKEYYSIGCGYFLLFQYNGNSHFSVFIFGLNATEIEYPSGPNEDMTPENIVDTEGDTSHRKKADGTETKNDTCDEIVDGLLTNNIDKNVNACDKILDELPIKKTAKDIKVNAFDEIVDDFRANKTSKDDKVEDDSYSGRQKSSVPLSFPSCLPERQDPSRVKLERHVEEDLFSAAQKGKKQEIDNEKLEKQNSEKNLHCVVDKGKEHCNKVPDPFACKMTKANQRYNKRKCSPSLEASYCRYPLRNKQVKVVKLEEKDEQQSLYYEAYKCIDHCNQVPVVDLSASKMTITNQHNEKKTATSLDASFCRYPLRSNQLKEVKLEQLDAASKTTITNQHNEKKTTASLDASRCRYPLRSNQLKQVKLEQRDAASKMTVANQHNEKKTSTSLDASRCRYPMRSMQLKEVKLEQQDGAANTMITNQHNEKKITAHLDASHCKYLLRSKHLKEVKLEQREVQGNMHSLRTKDTVVADPSNCKRQKSGLPACSPSCRPQRNGANKVKFEKLDMVEDSFCAAQTGNSKETNNVKLDKGDVEGNLYNAAFKAKDPSASKMTNTNQHNEGKNFTSLETSRCRYLLRSKLEQPKTEGRMYYLKPKIEQGSDGVTLAAEQLSTATCQVKNVDLREAHCSKLGNPYFVLSMEPAYVSRSFQLNIPANLINRSTNEDETIVTLRVSDGRTWDAKCSFYSNCAKIGPAGWRNFVQDNGLKVHDTCVFEMMEGIKPVLHVTIFRAMTPVS